MCGGLGGRPAVGEGGGEGVDDVGGLDGGVGDAFDHRDDVVAGFFEPLVGVVDDAAGFVGFDVVAVDDPFERCAAVDNVAVGVERDVAEDKVIVDADSVFGFFVGPAHPAGTELEVFGFGVAGEVAFFGKGIFFAGFVVEVKIRKSAASFAECPETG